MFNQPVDHRAGQPRHLGQQPEPARRHGRVEGVGRSRVAERLRHRDQVDQVGRGQCVELTERVVGRVHPAAAGHVVANHESPVGLDAGHQLLELEGEQPAVGAELHHVPGDFVGDASYHFQALHHRDRVAHGHQVFDLQRGQRAADLVEPQLVALQRGERLIGLGQDRGRVVEDVPLPVHVQPDDPHRLAHRDDREAGLLRDALRRTVSGARLFRGNRRVRHQMHGGTNDFGAVAGQHHGTVHLAQFAQPGRGELDVEREAAGTQGFDHSIVAEHDERTGAPAQDPLQSVAQCGARCHQGEVGPQRVGPGQATGPAPDEAVS